MMPLHACSMILCASLLILSGCTSVRLQQSDVDAPWYVDGQRAELKIKATIWLLGGWYEYSFVWGDSSITLDDLVVRAREVLKDAFDYGWSRHRGKATIVSVSPMVIVSAGDWWPEGREHLTASATTCPDPMLMRARTSHFEFAFSTYIPIEDARYLVVESGSATERPRVIPIGHGADAEMLIPGTRYQLAFLPESDSMLEVRLIEEEY